MYRQMIESLTYLMNTRLNIFFVVNTLSQFLNDTVDYGLKYEADQKINLEGYVDLDWAGSAIDRKRTSGCCFSMGLGVISWFSRKQSCVALSTAEAKYVAACSSSCEAVWPRKLLLIYLISRWMLLVYIVTNIVV